MYPDFSDVLVRLVSPLIAPARVEVQAAKAATRKHVRELSNNQIVLAYLLITLFGNNGRSKPMSQRLQLNWLLTFAYSWNDGKASDFSNKLVDLSHSSLARYVDIAERAMIIDYFGDKTSTTFGDWVRMHRGDFTTALVSPTASNYNSWIADALGDIDLLHKLTAREAENDAPETAGELEVTNCVFNDSGAGQQIESAPIVVDPAKPLRGSPTNGGILDEVNFMLPPEPQEPFSPWDRFVLWLKKLFGR